MLKLSLGSREWQSKKNPWENGIPHVFSKELWSLFFIHVRFLLSAWRHIWVFTWPTFKQRRKYCLLESLTARVNLAILIVSYLIICLWLHLQLLASVLWSVQPIVYCDTVSKSVNEQSIISRSTNCTGTCFYIANTEAPTGGTRILLSNVIFVQTNVTKHTDKYTQRLFRRHRGKVHRL